MLDPLIAETGDLDSLRVRAEVHRIAAQSLASIELNGRKLADERDPQPGVLELHAKDAGCTLKLEHANLEDNPVKLSYRGAPVLEHGLEELGLLDLTLVLEFGRASDILLASRDALTPVGRRIARDALWKALNEVYPRYLEGLRNDKGGTATARQSLERASLFSRIYLDVDSGTEWRQVKLLWRDEESMTANDLDSGDALVLSFPASQEGTGSIFDVPPDEKEAPFELDSDVDETNWIRDALRSFRSHAEYQGVFGPSAVHRYSFPIDDPKRSITPEAMKQLFVSLERAEKYRPFRPTFPSPDHERYARITFDHATLPAWARRHEWIVHKLVVCPVELRSTDLGAPPAVSVRHLGAYVKWVAEKKAVQDDDDALREIREQTQRFIEGFVAAFDNWNRADDGWPGLPSFDDDGVHGSAEFHPAQSAELLGVTLGSPPPAPRKPAKKKKS